MPRPRSIVSEPFQKSLLLTVAGIIALGLFWIAQELWTSRRAQEETRHDLISRRERELIEEVSNAAEYVEFERQRLIERTVREIEELVSARGGATHVEDPRYIVQLTTVDDEFPLSRENLDTLSGTGEVVVADNATAPDGVLSYAVAEAGRVIVIRTRPGSLRDELATVAGQWIGTIRFDEDGYVFAGSYEGVSIAGPRMGERVIDVVDRAGRHVVRDLIEKAKAGGGFLRYAMPEEVGERSGEKISYVLPIEEEQWYIGAGFFIAHVETALAEERDALLASIRWQILFMLATIALISCLVVLFSRMFSARISRSFNAFHAFFREASDNPSSRIPTGHPYREFDSLAVHANRMIERRQEAECNLRASVNEKEVLLRELHHRVKNNMQIVSSLLRLESDGTDNRELETFCRTSQDRVMAMALVHESLYQSDTLASMPVAQHLPALVGRLKIAWDTADRVSVATDIADVELPLTLAVPVSLVVNELVCNSFKHGFANGREGTITIRLWITEGDCIIHYDDDGWGLPEHFDIHNAESIGLQLMYGLIEQQLRGRVTLPQPPRATFELRFPLFSNSPDQTIRTGRSELDSFPTQ